MLPILFLEKTFTITNSNTRTTCIRLPKNGATRRTAIIFGNCVKESVPNILTFKSNKYNKHSLIKKQAYEKVYTL